MSKEYQTRDKSRAAFMKERGIQRTTGVCPTCYRVVTIDMPSKGTKFTHICNGGGNHRR